MTDDYGSFISNVSEVYSMQMQQNKNPNLPEINDNDMNNISRNSSDTDSITSMGSFIKNTQTLKLSENLSYRQGKNSPSKINNKNSALSKFNKYECWIPEELHEENLDPYEENKIMKKMNSGINDLNAIHEEDEGMNLEHKESNKNNENEQINLKQSKETIMDLEKNKEAVLGNDNSKLQSNKKVNENRENTEGGEEKINKINKQFHEENKEDLIDKNYKLENSNDLNNDENKLSEEGSEKREFKKFINSIKSNEKSFDLDSNSFSQSLNKGNITENIESFGRDMVIENKKKDENLINDFDDLKQMNFPIEKLRAIVNDNFEKTDENLKIEKEKNENENLPILENNYQYQYERNIKKENIKEENLQNFEKKAQNYEENFKKEDKIKEILISSRETLEKNLVKKLEENLSNLEENELKFEENIDDKKKVEENLTILENEIEINIITGKENIDVKLRKKLEEENLNLECENRNLEENKVVKREDNLEILENKMEENIVIEIERIKLKLEKELEGENLLILQKLDKILEKNIDIKEEFEQKLTILEKNFEANIILENKNVEISLDKNLVEENLISEKKNQYFKENINFKKKIVEGNLANIKIEKENIEINLENKIDAENLILENIERKKNPKFFDERNEVNIIVEKEKVESNLERKLEGENLILENKKHNLEENIEIKKEDYEKVEKNILKDANFESNLEIKTDNLKKLTKEDLAILQNPIETDIIKIKEAIEVNLVENLNNLENKNPSPIKVVLKIENNNLEELQETNLEQKTEAKNTNMLNNDKVEESLKIDKEILEKQFDEKNLLKLNINDEIQIEDKEVGILGKIGEIKDETIFNGSQPNNLENEILLKNQEKNIEPNKIIQIFSTVKQENQEKTNYKLIEKENLCEQNENNTEQYKHKLLNIPIEMLKNISEQKKTDDVSALLSSELKYEEEKYSQSIKKNLNREFTETHLKFSPLKTFENDTEEIVQRPKTISVESFKFQQKSSNYYERKESQKTPVKISLRTEEKKDFLLYSDGKSFM